MANNNGSPVGSGRMAPWMKNPNLSGNLSPGGGPGNPTTGPARTRSGQFPPMASKEFANPTGSFQQAHAKRLSTGGANLSASAPQMTRKVITEVLHSPALELVCPVLQISREFEPGHTASLERCPFDAAYYWEQSAEEIEVRVYQELNKNKHKAIPASAYAAEEGQRRKESLEKKMVEERKREEQKKEEERKKQEFLEQKRKEGEEEQRRKEEEEQRKKQELLEQKRKEEEEEQRRKKAEGDLVIGLKKNQEKKADEERRREQQQKKEEPLASSFSDSSSSMSEERRSYDEGSLTERSKSQSSTEIDFDKMSTKDIEIELDKPCVPTKWRAISSYTAKERRGLSFKEGETLKVLKKGSGVFWLAEAEKGGGRGLVPGYFLEEAEEEKVPGVVIKKKDGKKSLKKKKARDSSLQPRSTGSRKEPLSERGSRKEPLSERGSRKEPSSASSPVVMEVPNVQPANAQEKNKGLFGGHFMKGKKDKKKEKEKKTTLINWENLIIGETLSKVSMGSGTSIHVAYVDGFQCCMKELSFSVATAAQKRMIRGEIELLESLEPHRNVIRYLHHEEGKSFIRLFLTMYSATLSDLLRKRKEANSPLSAIDICFYCRLCLDGLQFLHGHGIIHRDIKAENVFLILGANGKVLEVALGDFDQAKNLGGGMTVTTIGTVGWMAPEMLLGGGYSFPADIYSFGMLLYEMLALTIPFEKESQFTLPDKVANGLKPEIPEEVANLPGYPELIAIQRECIEVQPENRPHLPPLQERFGEVFARLLKSG